MAVVRLPGAVFVAVALVLAACDGPVGGNRKPFPHPEALVREEARPYEPVEESAQPPWEKSDAKLLIADLRNRRIVITDLSGRLLWEFVNPTGLDHPNAGPLGVRWLPDNRILATFGTGEVGVIDVATKQWEWKTNGYNRDWFLSPYDADILPDGNLAVVTRYNDGGRIAVYDGDGRMVWSHLLADAHSLLYRSPEHSYGTDSATLIVGGWGAVREVTYEPGVEPQVVWEASTEYTHDVFVDGDHLLTTEGYYIQKIDRAANQVWRHDTPGENRRIALLPGGGYIFSVAERDRIEFRDSEGALLDRWSELSDGSTLDYPYGIRVIDYPG